MKLTLRLLTLAIAMAILINLLFGWAVFVETQSAPINEAFIIHFSSFTGLGLDTQNLTFLGKTYSTIDSALGLLSIPVLSALVAYRIAVLNLEKLIDSYLTHKKKLPKETVKVFGPLLVSVLQQDPVKTKEIIEKLNELITPKKEKNRVNS